MKKTALLSGTSNFFGPSYFETALAGLRSDETEAATLESGINVAP